MLRPSWTCDGSNCALPATKGGILRSTFNFTDFNMSLIVNPLSAITAVPGHFEILSRKPETFVSSTSEMDPTYPSEMKQMQPLGVQATRNLQVLCDLYIA